MRNITFHEVGMENFGPYIDPMVLTFENDTLTLITGPNGIGKTMSLEAIPFTLFGETCKKAKGDDVVNTRVGRNCHTWVKFSINDDKYQVDRYHKYTKLQNTVLISKNGEEPYKKGHREVLPEIEMLICSKKSFTNTLMFGQKVKDFFTDLVDSDKKEIFRKILDLDIYTTWYKMADEDIKEIKEKLQQLLEKVGIDKGILSNTEQQIELLVEQQKQFEEDKKEKIDELRNSLSKNERLTEQWKKEFEELNDGRVDVQELQVKMNDVEKQISHHETEKSNTILQMQKSRDAKIAEMNEEANKAVQKIVESKRKYLEILLQEHDESIKKLTDEESEANKYLNDNRVKISELDTEMRICENEAHNLNESLEIEDGICPTCLRDIDDSCREHLEKEHLNAVDRYKEFERQKKSIEKSQETYKVLLDRIHNDIREQQKQFVDAKKQFQHEEDQEKREVQDKLETAVKKIHEMAEEQEEKIEEDYDEYLSNLNKKLKGIKEEVNQAIEVDRHVKEIEAILSNLEGEKSRFEFQLGVAEESEYDKSQLNSYHKQKIELINSIEAASTNVTKLQDDQKLSEFWKSAWSPSGIPSMLIDESIPFMNEKVSEYLEKLTNGRYIVSFDTLAATKAGEFRDKISVNVLDTYTRANSRIQLSGGQTRLVDIATILTLGDLQSMIQDVNINILLFDEIFDSLDEENIGFVSKILSQLKIGKSIYLISHTQVDQLEADEILELK